MLIQSIEHTKLDIIGDVHGEIEALNTLLKHLNYNEDGEHPEDRVLIFVGDLFDRGTNSWAVYKKVKHLMKKGRAFCIQGNHELNLLIPDPNFTDDRPKVKAGNEWFHGQVELVNKDDPLSIQPQYLLHTQQERDQIRNFLRPLPLAICAPGIRIVHACWDNDAIHEIQSKTQTADILFSKYEQQCTDRIATQVRDYLNKNPEENTENLTPSTWFKRQSRAHPIRIEAELIEQNQNPIKVITSGKERRLGPHQAPYEAGKKTRYVKRDPWWTNYQDDQVVVFGHYWRKAPYPNDPIDLTPPEKRNIPATFSPEEGPLQWLGPKKNAMCVDYSVGKRFLERHHNLSSGKSGSYLACFRYTKTSDGFDAKLVFDNGNIETIL